MKSLLEVPLKSRTKQLAVEGGRVELEPSNVLYFPANVQPHIVPLTIKQNPSFPNGVTEKSEDFTV